MCRKILEIHITIDLLRFESESRVRILFRISLGADHLIHPVIRTRRIDIVLEKDSLALGRMDHRGSLVPVRECLGAHVLLGDIQSGNRNRSH